MTARAKPAARARLGASEPPSLASRATLSDVGVAFAPLRAACAALAKLPRLAALSLHNSLLGAPGGEALVGLLRASRSLRLLDISRCA